MHTIHCRISNLKKMRSYYNHVTMRLQKGVLILNQISFKHIYLLWIGKQVSATYINSFPLCNCECCLVAA